MWRPCGHGNLAGNVGGNCDRQLWQAEHGPAASCILNATREPKPRVEGVIQVVGQDKPAVNNGE